MNKHLGHGVAANIDVFNFLRGDVLSLCQLKNVFLSVNNLQSAILQGTTRAM